ncbi:50S ribosomal protein L4, partial [Campylobacter coli]
DLLDEKTLLAYRNLANCYVVDVTEVNAYLVSVFNAVIMEKSAIECEILSRLINAILLLG